MKRLALILIVLASPAYPYNLGKVLAEKPEAIVSGPRDLFDVERCIILVDEPSEPQVYRAPDRPNESLIYYATGIGHPIAYKLNSEAGRTTVTMFGTTKHRERIEACVNA